MDLTIAHLVHRVPDDLRTLGRRSVEAAPEYLAGQHRGVLTTPNDAAWAMVSASGDRQTMVPVPIAVMRAAGDRGQLDILLGIDMDGALAIAWREGGRMRMVRAAEGGLTDPVRTELDHLLDHSRDLVCKGPLPESLETMRSIRSGLVGEVEHRPLDPRRIEGSKPLPHPWLDPVFAAVADAHGADQRMVLRTATLAGKIPAWLWLGENPRGADGAPVPGTITGLPHDMPFFNVQNRKDCDIMKIGSGSTTYRRRGADRFLAMTRATLPETVWAVIAPGTRADTIWDLPGLDAFEVERLDEGETTLVHLRPRA